MKHYKYFITGKDTYKIIRVDNKFPKGHKDRYKEYLVDFRNGDTLCDCPGFQSKINAMRRGKKIKGIVSCKHVKDILENLKDGGGIIQVENEKSNYDLGLVKCL